MKFSDFMKMLIDDEHQYQIRSHRNDITPGLKYSRAVELAMLLSNINKKKYEVLDAQGRVVFDSIEDIKNATIKLMVSDKFSGDL